MTNRKKWWIAILVVALAVLAFALRARFVPTSAGPGASPSAGRVTSPNAAAPPPVPTLQIAPAEIFTVAPGSLARTLPVTGTLKPVNQSLIKSKVPGELRELSVREGMSVRAGQVVARVDPTDFQLRVTEREAALRSALAQREQAQRTLENNRQLLAKGFISQNAFDTASSGLDVARAGHDVVASQLAQARKALADTAIVSPIAGVVAERFVQPGEKVSPDTRILSVIDLTQMEIEVAVPATEIGSVRVGQRVELKVDGAEERRPATVARIAPGTQAGTRSVPMYLSVSNLDQRMRAGMFAQGTLALERRSGVLTIPMAAVRDANGRKFVYAIEAERIVERDVRLGARDESTLAADGSPGVFEVLEGLRAGERIVGVNLGPLRAGARVEASAAATLAPPPAAAPPAAPAARP